MTNDVFEVTVQLEDSLVAALTKKGAPPTSYRIAETLGLFEYLQSVALDEMRNGFTESEILLIADACNGFGYIWRMHPKQQLALEVQEAIEFDALDEKWGVDKESLLNKLDYISEFHAHTILVTLEKCWDRRRESSDKSLDILLLEAFQGEPPEEHAMLSAYSIQKAIFGNLGGLYD